LNTTNYTLGEIAGYFFCSLKDLAIACFSYISRQQKTHMPQGQHNNRRLNVEEEKQKTKINMSDLSQGGNCKGCHATTNSPIDWHGNIVRRTNFFRSSLF
jgi:hypothetical protein